jgi:hypothetical protein
MENKNNSLGSPGSAKIQCIRHPKYDGVHAPELTCQICCTMYLDGIRQSNDSFEPFMKINEKKDGKASPASERQPKLKRDFFIEL